MVGGGALYNAQVHRNTPTAAVDDEEVSRENLTVLDFAFESKSNIHRLNKGQSII